MADTIARIITTERDQPRVVAVIPTPSALKVARPDTIRVTTGPTNADEIGAYSTAEVDALIAAKAQALSEAIIAAAKASNDSVESLRAVLGEAAFHFTVPVNQWVIQHNLGRRYPDVSLVDSSGDEIMTDLTPVDGNTIIATFAVPTAGTAFVN